jgi:hypothetical protein
MYNKFMIINFIVTKKMLPKFFGTIQFVVIKNNHTMIKLSLMTSHMSIVTNGWNVGAILFIGAKSNCNYCLILCFYTNCFQK